MTNKYSIGDFVQVLPMYPLGHLRTPFYIRGKIGWINSIEGDFPNPEERAYGRDGLPKQTLYRVRFLQKDLWPDYTGSAKDTIEIELYQHWLKPVKEKQ